MDLEMYLDKIKRNRFIPTPPDEKIFVGGSIVDFRQVGIDTLRSLIMFGHVTPTSKILEIGSGIGRVALPLTQWLGDEGRYVGTDIVKHGVEWCNENISSRYENFQFLHMDIYNEYYNPLGRERVEDLPLPPKYFDVAVFNSVFTHLTADDTETYIKLVRKHLVDSGILWGSWFLMDDESRRLVHDGKSSLKFILDDGKRKTFHLDKKGKSTAAVAYDFNYIKELFAANGFSIEKLDKGKWCERSIEYGGYQDLIVGKLT